MFTIRLFRPAHIDKWFNPFTTLRVLGSQGPVSFTIFMAQSPVLINPRPHNIIPISISSIKQITERNVDSSETPIQSPETPINSKFIRRSILHHQFPRSERSSRPPDVRLLRRANQQRRSIRQSGSLTSLIQQAQKRRMLPYHQHLQIHHQQRILSLKSDLPRTNPSSNRERPRSANRIRIPSRAAL